MGFAQLGISLVISALVMIAKPYPAQAEVNYEFCLTRISNVKSETFGIRYKFPVADLGKEAARVVASQKYKDVGTTSVSISDYNPTNCGQIQEETSFSATGEQVSDLGKAIARGDVAGTTVAILALGTGTTVTVVTGIGGAIGSAAHWIGCRLGIGC